jgi:hypothetical protein
MIMRINKFLPVAIIYFFVNSMGLPFGLTYTTLLAPLLYWWIINRRNEILLPFFACLAPFLIIQAAQGVDTKTYIISLVNYTAVYIFCQSFYTFLQVARQPEKIFRTLLVINFILCLLAIPLYFSNWQTLLWMPDTVISGVANFNRLKLFTYEASYYAILFTPLFFFYLLQLAFRQHRFNAWILLPMLVLPYLLSFSIGVVGAALFAIAVTGLLYAPRLLKKKRILRLLLLSAITVSCIVLALAVFFPANSVFTRIAAILAGNDTSGNGRTFEAFMLAKQILQQRNTLWGTGPGQIKILGGDIIRSYYLYPLDYNTIAIPNAAAETLAIFGWVGLALRITIEWSLFFITRVWTNYYRLLLFLFIFLYQFTGSFITNIAEYVIWILAFTNAFPAFDVVKRSRYYRQQPSISAA